MKVELGVALIAGAVALASASGTIWSSVRNTTHSNANAKAIEQLKIDSERTKSADQRRREIFSFSEPLARSAYDLQSRLFNIIKKNLVLSYFGHGSDREKSYVIDNTVFLIGQYLCWTEVVRREIQFIDLGESTKTRDLLRLQDNISNLWGTDEQPPTFRVFAGEQRALGEAFIQMGVREPECIGYGAFLNAFKEGANPLIDFLREDVRSLGRIEQATARLTNIQHALVDLLQMLDPDYARFPKDRRSKV